MPRKKKDDLPDWLRSTHQELASGMTLGAETIPLKKGRTPGPAQEKELAKAYVLLEVTPEEVEASVKIEHLFRGIVGGPSNGVIITLRDKIFEYLSGSEEPEARKILDLRKRLNQKQAAIVPFEAYCVAAQIPAKKMFGVVSAEVMDQEDKAKQLMVRARHSQVVEATIENALDPLGAVDRKMLHQATGFVPVPKNSITHIHGHQITDNRTQTANIAVLPPVEDTVRRLGDRFNEKILDVLALPAPPQPLLESGEDDEDA